MYRSAVRSRELLHEAMLDLICEKELNDITIKEVVARAQVNRSTFYAHYSNLGQLAESIELELLEYLKKQFYNRVQSISPEWVVKQVIALFDRYPQLQKGSAKNASFVAFMHRVFNRYLDLCIQEAPISSQENAAFRTRLQLAATLPLYGILNADSGLWSQKASYIEITSELINLCRKL